MIDWWLEKKYEVGSVHVGTTASESLLQTTYSLPTIWFVLMGCLVALRLGKTYRVVGAISLVGVLLAIAGVLILFPSYVQISSFVITIGWLTLSIVQMLAGLNQRSVMDGENVSTTIQQQHKYRPEIDGLRAFAIIPVVIYHAFPELYPVGLLV